MTTQAEKATNTAKELSHEEWLEQVMNKASELAADYLEKAKQARHEYIAFREALDNYRKQNKPEAPAIVKAVAAVIEDEKPDLSHE